MLAHWLEVSAPAVTMALKRLKRDGFVNVDDDGIVRLTASGREMAYRTALRHHLVERMLTEIFGMEWHEIHEEAERLEHAVSPAFEAKLREKLGDGAPARTAMPFFPKIQQYGKAGVRFSFPRQLPGGGMRSLVSMNAIPGCSNFFTASASGRGRKSGAASQNYDQTVSIELPTGKSILGRPAAEAVWLRPEK